MQVSSKNQINVAEPPPEGLYRFLAGEIAHQLARKQEIFTWASSLLVAIIGGIVLLTSIHQVTLAVAHKLALTGAILTLSGFACFWIEMHWEAALRARNQLSFYYDRVSRTGQDRPWQRDYTCIAAILALASMGLLAVWITIRPSAS
jgi:hypothetical protein